MDPDILAKLDDFFKQYPKRSYPKDHIIIFSGDDPHTIFYIASGTVSQYDISYRGDEIVTNVFKPPAFFPMAIALSSTVNHFFYKAETESTVYLAPPEDVIDFLKHNPEVMLDLLRRLYTGVEGILGRMVHLMSGSAKSRLVYELVVESRRFGQQTDTGDYALTINETQLASRSGLSRETVSREMKKLKDIGAVSMRPHEIHIIDLLKLEALLGEDI